MANEFIARNGIISLDNSQITGSLNVSNGITGNLTGNASTATSASFAQTASFVTTAQTASFVLNAVSASFAQTASTLAGGIPQSFPYTGSAIISGSLVVTGSTNLTGSLTVNTTGTEFQVLPSGVVIGNALTDLHRITGSVNISGSLLVNGAAPGGGGASFPYTGSAIISGSLQTTGSVTLSYVAGLETWVSAGNLIVARSSMGGAGTSAAGLVFGGPNTLTCTEAYNGTSWSVASVMITGRTELAGAGTQGAALAFGGRNPQGTSATERYNGTSWSTATGLNVARAGLSGAGETNSAVLAFGGFTYPAFVTVTCSEVYNGTSWTNTNPLIQTRYLASGTGTSTAAINMGGTLSPTGVVGCTETYNGTSWSAQASMIVPRYVLGGSGTTTLALAFGGTTATPGSVNCTEKYTGTWAVGNALIAARRAPGKSIAATSATFVAGGAGNPATLASAEKVCATATNCVSFTYSAATGATTLACLVETSAQRYKDNVKPLTSQLERLKQLNPVEFDWKANQKHDIGFIAEEVQKVYPEVVNINEQGEVEGLSYSKLGAALTKAVQEQQVQIQTQQTQIELLLNEINNLKNK